MLCVAWLVGTAKLGMGSNGKRKSNPSSGFHLSDVKWESQNGNEGGISKLNRLEKEERQHTPPPALLLDSLFLAHVKNVNHTVGAAKMEMG